LLAPALFAIGRRAFGERAGLAAGGIAALYPELVWFAAHFWAETLFTVLLWWAMERLLAADDPEPGRAATGAAAVSGALFGLAVLTRETVLYFLPLAAAWLAWRRAGGGRRAGVLLATAGLVIVPWTVRNWIVFDALVPVSTSGALNLWQGNTRLSRQQVYEENWAIHGRIAQYHNARRRGIEAVLERQPRWLLEKLKSELPDYWAAHGQPIVHIERGAYGSVRRARAFLAIAVVLLPYLALLVAFVAGVALRPPGRAPLLLLAFLAFYVLLHVASHGYPRYRLPSLPVLFLFAAHGWVAWRAGERASARDRAAAAAVALVLALSVGPSLWRWASEPWPPPWFVHAEGDAAEPPAGEGPAPEGP